MLTSKLVQPARRIFTSALRNGETGGVFGENLPFQVKNKYRFTLMFTLFFASSFGLPFFLVRHQMKK